MTGMSALPGHGRCATHKGYWLTCEQYEGLLAACGNRCQTCGQAGRDCPPLGKLYIDHEQTLGVWAVRGLLCPPCNSRLTWDCPDTDWAKDYLANPWFKSAFAEMGVSLDPQPEPPLGSQFRSPKRSLWVREEDGWRCRSYSRLPRSWIHMRMTFSPLHLREINAEVRT